MIRTMNIPFGVITMSAARTFLKTVVTMALASLSSASMAGFIVTIEAAGVVNTTATFTPIGQNGTDLKGVETFDGLLTGNGQNFISNFGGAAHGISGTYTGVNVIEADQFGGAGGVPNQYAVAGLQNNVKSYSITFNPDLTYFGYWLSALDAGNQVEFFLDGASVFTFTPVNVLAMVGTSGDYYGKPLAPNKGANKGEPYVFLNFFADQGAFFDEIVFSQVPPGSTAGYESDNHTVGVWEKQSGTVVNSVPLPSTVLLTALGLAALGVTRRRQV